MHTAGAHTRDYSFRLNSTANQPAKRFGDAAASMLAKALGEMHNLEVLNLGGKLSMVSCHRPLCATNGICHESLGLWSEGH